MKLPIFVSSPLSASLLLAACLLAPQLVLSKSTNDIDRIADLAPTIDRMVGAVRFASRRSLQADSAFADFFEVDDDVVLDYLATAGIDKDLEQCIVDTEAYIETLEGQTFELDGQEFEAEEYADAFAGDDALDFDMDIDIESMKVTVSIGYSDAFEEQIRDLCDIIGGYFTSSSDISCSMMDSESGMETVMSISNLGMCMADTPACRNGPNPIVELMKLSAGLEGTECVSAGPETLPEPEPETLPKPEPETLPEPEPETLPEPEPETLPEPAVTSTGAEDESEPKGRPQKPVCRVLLLYCLHANMENSRLTSLPYDNY